MMRDKRYLWLAVLGFLLGRVFIYAANPFAIAFYWSAAKEKKGRKWMITALLLGILSSGESIGLLKYTFLLMVLGLIDAWYRKNRNQTISCGILALLTGGANLIFCLGLSFLSLNTWELLISSLLEMLMVYSLCGVFQEGVHYILCGEWNGRPTNEELISLIIIIFCSLYGVPWQWESIFSIVDMAAYGVVFFMGARYGAAIGAFAGVSAGVLAYLNEEGIGVLGIYCVFGMISGLLNKMGKWLDLLICVLTGMGAIYLLAGEVSGVMALRSLLSAAVVCGALPGSWYRCPAPDAERQRDPFEHEDIRELANGKIEDFSNAFRRLSKSLDGKNGVEQDLSPEEMERIFTELSSRVCSDCVNCKYCWEKHFYQTKENMEHMLWQAGKEGTISISGLSPEFGRRCVRLASYVEQAEQRVAIAKQSLGWRNRLAEHREVMARQMMEVAAALKSFTLEIGDDQDVPDAWRVAMGDELRRVGVKVKHFGAKKTKGRLEVAFTGCCQGNQCLTKTDLAQCLYQGTGIPMRPTRETRNVLGTEEATMIFCEETKWRALTGLARVAKSGESVSGDNFSFLELQTGELLMVLADGMGSGEMAYKDSVNLIEVLEHLLEAGFEKKSALRLLNLLFFAGYEGETFATLDMSAINLYTGECSMYKSGAVATFIRKKDGVQTVEAQTLPVGVDKEAQCESQSVQLEEGDMVIMVTDGVLDGFYDGRIPVDEPEDTLENLIYNLPVQNPNDMAHQILMNALARSHRDATDDMSVLVAGIWGK